MKKQARGKPVRENREDLEEALAVLIASTKRVRRSMDLVQVARYLEIARRKLGSLKAVGEAIGLSDEMLRQFASINKLSPKVQGLITARKIDSVDMAYRLSQLPLKDQCAVARLAAQGTIDSDDVRAIVSLCRASPDLDVAEAVRRVKSSRNVKEYVVQFPIPKWGASEPQLRARFGTIVGEGNIRSLRTDEHPGVLILSREGVRRLQDAAKARGTTKRRIVERILSGGVG